MYVEGTVVELDKTNYRVKILIEEFDSFITPWLVVPQKFVVTKKSGYMPELNALVSVVLSDDMSHGAILGAIYNDVDIAPFDMSENDFIKYEDGSIIAHNANSETIDFIDCSINCTNDVSDKNGTMQAIRDYINNHTHSNGNNGSATGSPIEKI